jgi:hypothetical protein
VYLLLYLIHPPLQVFVDQIFRIFDKDSNGSIDFKVRCPPHCTVTLRLAPSPPPAQEFMLATDMTASGSPEEKLRWAFRMYDKDGSGGAQAALHCTALHCTALRCTAKLEGHD